MGIVSGIVLGVFLFVFLKTRAYQKEYVSSLEDKEARMKFLYPMSLWLILESPLGKLVRDKDQQRELMAQLYIGEDTQEMQILYWCKKLSLVILILVAVAGITLSCSVEQTGEELLKEEHCLDRDKAEGGSKEVSLIVSADGKEDLDLTVEVPRRQYNLEELEKKLEEAKEYIRECYLGENEDPAKINKPLNLVSSIPDSAIEVSWSVDQEEVISEDGSLENGLLEESVDCTLIACLAYGDQQENLEFSITVLPAKEMSQTEWETKVSETMEEAGQEQVEEASMELPETIMGRQVTYKEAKEEDIRPVLWGMALVVGIALWIALDRDLQKKYQNRELQMLLDYPEIINKFTLLVSAGMTINGAWGKIANEYERKRKQKLGKERYAYEEWCLTWREICNGVTELQALEHFGQRCRLLPYLKFSTLLGQNLRKGSKGLLEVLEYEAMDAFENRKQNTKRLAEEAGTKMLIPMILMLVLVVLIIMTPALMSF